MPTSLIVLAALCGVMTTAGVSNLIAWRYARHERDAGYFGFLCLTAAGYTLAQLAIFSTPDVVEAASLLRIQGAMSAVSLGLVPLFAAAFTRTRPDRFDLLCVAVYVALAAWSLASPAGYWFARLDGMEATAVSGGTIYQPRGPMAWTYGLSMAFQYPVFLRQLHRGWQLARSGERLDGSLWAIAMAAVIVGATHDHLVDAGWASPPYLVESVLPLFILTMFVRLAVRRSREHERIRELQSSLEASDLRLREVYERELAEQARVAETLRRSEERFRTLFNGAEDGILLMQGAEIVDANPRAVAMFGLERREDLLGHSPGDFSPAEQPDGISSHDAVAQRTTAALAGTTQRFEWVHRRVDGTPLLAEVSLAAIELAGRPHLLAVVRDVTERERLARRLRESQRLEAIGQLAAGVAHDFNNLLTPILGYTDLLLAETADGGSNRDDLDQVRQAADSAQRLVRQLLSFGRREEMDAQTIDLRRVVRRLEPLLRRLIRENVSLQMIEPDQMVAVRADVSQLEQVVVNLVVNGRDAMPAGGALVVTVSRERVTVTTPAVPSACPPGDYAVLTVADTGVGLSADARSHLFEPFYTTKPAGVGTGLGLPTVLGIVREHGGYIAVEGAPGRGATFTVYLPLAQPGEDEALAVAGSGESKIEGGANEVVLVVEDDDNVREFVRRALHDHGYRPFTAASPERALALIPSLPEPPALLITDIVMPRMNGRQLHAAIAGTLGDLPVLYMSGYSGEIASHHGVVDEGLVLLRKPFTFRELLHKARVAMESRTGPA